MAQFSSSVTKLVKRHLLEICDNQPWFLAFVHSMCRQYRSVRHTSQRKYGCSKVVYNAPGMFSVLNNLKRNDIDVKHFSTKSHRSYYDVLGVTPNATQSQIKTAYYTLSKQHHPDTKTADKENVVFLEISEAYEVLGNVKKRRLYDRGILRPHHQHDIRDYKHEHDEEGPQSGFQSQVNEMHKKRRVYTGHTKIYNFDKHYQKHYSDLLNRKAKAESNIRKRQKMDREYEMSKQSEIAMCVTFVGFIMIAYLSTFLPK